MATPGAGALVLAFLHSPKERVWGVLQGYDGGGVWVEGIDLDSFEDWARQIGRDKVDDNDNNTDDHMGYRSGEHADAASRPQLVVTYVE